METFASLLHGLIATLIWVAVALQAARWLGWFWRWVKRMLNN